MTRSYKLILLGTLYLAQGLPYGFFSTAVPALLRDAGLSLKQIASTSILYLPWLLKFLVAPFVDHVGTRRQWILPMQAGAIVTALLLAQGDFRSELTVVFIGLFMFNICAAVQDIATDGLGVRLLTTPERGLANGLQVGTYRLGMVIGSGLLLSIFASVGWPGMLYAMAAALLLTTLPVLFLHEDAAPAASAARPRMRELVLGWMARLRVRGMLTLLGLVTIYKFGDTMAASLVAQMIVDHGYGMDTVGLIKGVAGSVMGLCGAAAGGWLAFRIGRRLTLLGCGLLQTASLLLYALAAYTPGNIDVLWGASICEHLFGGMATVALFTLMMDASDPEHAGTDYTLLACAVVLAQALAAMAGGVLGDAFGYGPAFICGFALSGIGCLVLVRALDRGHGPARLRELWSSGRLA